jgi:hypothetical protein
VAGAQVTWASSNPGRATVDSTGRVVAMAGGPVEITASYEGVAARTALVVDGRATTELILFAGRRNPANGGAEIWRMASDGSVRARSRPVSSGTSPRGRTTVAASSFRERTCRGKTSTSISGR